METRKYIAAEKKRCGSHNCAQAILCTYADKVGIDEETARNIANSFGAGMGNMEGTEVVLRECPDCVADAAEFLEEQLHE